MARAYTWRSRREDTNGLMSDIHFTSWPRRLAVPDIIKCTKTEVAELQELGFRAQRAYDKRHE